MIALVKFDGSYKDYAFKTDLELQGGDTVVCDTTHGLSIGKVVGFQDSSNLATKWILCKVDLEKHEERIKKEKKLKEIKKKMDLRRKQHEEITFYKMIAEKDEEMANLLKEYEELNK